MTDSQLLNSQHTIFFGENQMKTKVVHAGFEILVPDNGLEQQLLKNTLELHCKNVLGESVTGWGWINDNCKHTELPCFVAAHSKSNLIGIVDSSAREVRICFVDEIESGRKSKGNMWDVPPAINVQYGD